jgi:uncharacterized membrane protein YdjX (TVP38/TMEM64 family)
MDGWRRRALVLVLLVLAGAVAAAVVGVPTRAGLEAWLTDLGPVAPVAFVLGYAVAVLTPVPKNVLAVTAGWVFGLGWGVGLVWVASMLGAVAAFALAHSLGREAVEVTVGDRVATVDAALRRHGTLAVVGLRLVPVLPFSPVSYALGLTAVPWGAYVAGTAVGIVPGTVAHVAVGASVTGASPWTFVLAVVVVMSLGLAGAAAARRWRRGLEHGLTRR